MRGKPHPQHNKKTMFHVKHGFLLCHPERKRRIFAPSTEKKILRHFVPQNDKGRGHYALMLKQGFFSCHPERKRRIFAPSTEKKILRHFVPQNDKGRGHYALMLKQGFFSCHPERKRRIFAVSKEKRFFVTSFLRMTYMGGAPERIQGFYLVFV